MKDLPDNVVAIETRFTEGAPVELLQQRWDACKHPHTVLDDKLRTVSCRDCGEERLDPFEVLLSLSRQWSKWRYEAEQLRKLNAEWRDHERDKWERARDRHLGANPEHSGKLVVGRSSWNWFGDVTQPCRTCYRLERDYQARWYPTPAKEPPPGRLLPSDEPA